MNLEVIVFIIYLAFMLGIGIYFFFRDKDGGEKTYFLGERQMGPWVAALSAGASDRFLFLSLLTASSIEISHLIIVVFLFL